MEPNVKEDLKALFEILDWTEESDSGRVFNPVTISSVRVHLTMKLTDILARLKEYANGN